MGQWVNKLLQKETSNLCHKEGYKHKKNLTTTHSFKKKQDFPNKL
jgi:hypothetical protein